MKKQYSGYLFERQKNTWSVPDTELKWSHVNKRGQDKTKPACVINYNNKVGVDNNKICVDL